MKILNLNTNKKLIVNYTLLFFLSLIYSSCTVDTNQVLEERNFQLIWSDEFEGQEGEAINPDNWVIELGRGPNGDGWGNAELQSYTNNTNNVALDGQGNLVITARNSGGFTSARIKTQGLFAQQYGRFEARIKTPYGQGIWPAFWLLGSNIESVGWPQCGEIDIMELRGQEPNVIHGSLHGPGYSQGSPITKSYGFENERFDTDFHVFAIEWDKNSIDYYVDDFLYQQITPEDAPGEWVYDNPFFIILNVAVGGNYVGFPSDLTPFPQTMIVDWVRVHEEVQ